jgi:hypothetical protein
MKLTNMVIKKRITVWILYPVAIVAGFALYNIYKGQPIFDDLLVKIPWVVFGLILLIGIDLIHIYKRRGDT